MASPFFGFGKYQVDSVNKHLKLGGGRGGSKPEQKEIQEELELLALKTYLNANREIQAGKTDKLTISKKEEKKGFFKTKITFSKAEVDLAVTKNESSHIFGRVNGQCFEAVVYSDKPNDISIVSVKKTVNPNTMQNEYQIHFVAGNSKYQKGMTYSEQTLPSSYKKIIENALLQTKEETMNLC